MTPAFSDAEVVQYASWISRVAAVTTADGRVLVATSFSRLVDDGYETRTDIWDLETGRRLSELNGHTSFLHDVAWGEAPDGRSLLATASRDRTIRIWGADTGETVQVLNAENGPVDIAWARAPDGRSLLAAAEGSSSVPVWDTDTGALLRRIDLNGERALHVTWLRTADGRLLLMPATGTSTPQLWDPGTGQCAENLTWLTQPVYSSAWTRTANGQAFLATGPRRNNGARIYNADTGVHLHDVGSGHAIVSMAWAETADGRLLLATANEDETARIWDAQTGTELASMMANSFGDNVSWARDRRGNLLLLTVDEAEGMPFHAWLVEEALPGAPVSADSSGTPPEAMRSLLRLGAGGWWLPLSLISDLITITESSSSPPDPATLHDLRVAALVADPGIARLRDLAGREPRWTREARASFAPLLTGGIDFPDQYAPPDDASPAELRDALSRALVSPRMPEASGKAPAETPVADLKAAAADITDQMVTLLSILGPEACAADPLLPTRLAHRAPRLPALSPRELRTLTASHGGRPGGATAAGTLAWSPGTAGLARNGPLTRLLPVQFALPRELLAARLAEDQLLYRQHRAPTPPAPQPVTLILDVSPPTFGPAGTALRLAAHLVTTTLWAHGHRPALITLSTPDTATELRAPADLIGIWTAASLDPPGAALAAARRTAAALGQPSVLLTHHLTARDVGYAPGPGSRLLTVRQPPEQPPAPGGPWQAHLPPEPAHDQLTAAVSALIYPPSSVYGPTCSG